MANFFLWCYYTIEIWKLWLLGEGISATRVIQYFDFIFLILNFQFNKTIKELEIARNKMEAGWSKFYVDILLPYHLYPSSSDLAKKFEK